MSTVLNGTIELVELVKYIRSTLPNFYGQIEHQSAHVTIQELHDLVSCNELFVFDEKTSFDNNSVLETYLHTLYLAIKPKISYIESLYA